ncbi:hypothetical protein AJ80_08134 [Polytolypa hystricis UAMH7299]|uniref:Exonuclease V, mitochondrial n=1 Tax=Polytolypa hystricis (strain UAMH7299) TaxID=1447883 RepID=A0A2B7XC58_POLH7|nr:hypothetical protein AJ80_08134 [Polytolypa hystricis UAMH7299]
MSCPTQPPSAQQQNPLLSDANLLAFASLSSSSSSSDYGSDFTPDEEEVLNELLAKAAGDQPATSTELGTAVSHEKILRDRASPAAVIIPDIEDAAGLSIVAAVEDTRVEDHRGAALHNRTTGWRATSVHIRTEEAIFNAGSRELKAGSAEHPDSPEGREKERQRDRELEEDQVAEFKEQSRVKPANVDQPFPDTRSPLDRFRKPPRKALSVTDLVSPAWCELQYWYTLTKHGRKRPTLAMKQGSAVHKTLEEQVHTTVPVEVMTREDSWALRIWNVIQGLRTLRATGMTRELEVWGVVDGEVVTGIIDQLSYECPDPELDASADKHFSDVQATRSLFPEYQTSLTEFLLSSGGRKLSQFGFSGSKEPASEEQPSADSTSSGEKKVYITDIKSRGASSRSIPSIKSTGFRPTHLQLQLYYHFLTRLITSNDVTIDAIASRYRLQSDRAFSDTFIAQISSLNPDFFDVSESPNPDTEYVPPSNIDGSQQSPSSAAEQDALAILLEHNSLSRLWSLMKSQLRLTFLSTSHPATDSSTTQTAVPSAHQTPISTLISPVLTATYISSAHSPSEPINYLGSRSFLFDPHSLYSYITDEMHWWRGHRAAKGVPVYEAWKCRICEFRDSCTWRANQEEAMARSRRRRRESLMGVAGDGDGKSDGSTSVI